MKTLLLILVNLMYRDNGLDNLDCPQESIEKWSCWTI